MENPRGPGIPTTRTVRIARFRSFRPVRPVSQLQAQARCRFDRPARITAEPPPAAPVSAPRPQVDALLEAIAACTLCREHLPHRPRPVLQWHPGARVLVAGQAPGRRVHGSGIPFDDPSGERLRDWMGVSREVFYDARQVAILPMGFCYPGTGKSGDLPPRPECAPAWRERLLASLADLRLTLVIGKYAQDYHLPGAPNVTERVRDWRDHRSRRCIPLPHPSPRNNRWLRRNPWFETDLLPALRADVRRSLASP